MFATGVVSFVMGLILAACAHRTRIESHPPGASVYVDDVFVCVSPCFYERPAAQLDEHTPLRLTRPGYQPVESELETRIMPSRIMGGIFTLGLVPLFKWPKTYPSKHSFNLRPLSVEERLDDLRQRRDAGELSDGDYEQLRRGLLGTR
jgi:hypothetical protein